MVNVTLTAYIIQVYIEPELSAGCHPIYWDGKQTNQLYKIWGVASWIKKKQVRDIESKADCDAGWIGPMWIGKMATQSNNMHCKDSNRYTIVHCLLKNGSIFGSQELTVLSQNETTGPIQEGGGGIFLPALTLRHVGVWHPPWCSRQKNVCLGKVMRKQIRFLTIIHLQRQHSSQPEIVGRSCWSYWMSLPTSLTGHLGVGLTYPNLTNGDSRQDDEPDTHMYANTKA